MAQNTVWCFSALSLDKTNIFYHIILSLLSFIQRAICAHDIQKKMTQSCAHHPCPKQLPNEFRGYYFDSSISSLLELGEIFLPKFLQWKMAILKCFVNVCQFHQIVHFGEKKQNKNSEKNQKCLV